MKISQTIKFTCLYRDAGNSKAWGEVAFSNPTNLPCSEVDTRLSKAFDMGCLFIADQIQIPEVFLYANGEVITEDHCFHEFDSVKVSLEKATDAYQRSIEFFVRQVEKENRRGWRAFNPIDKVFGGRV
ncbi:MAG: hypothetical protein ACKVRP_04750 [Bacteroidota bacterium]